MVVPIEIVLAHSSLHSCCQPTIQRVGAVWPHFSSFSPATGSSRTRCALGILLRKFYCLCCTGGQTRWVQWSVLATESTNLGLVTELPPLTPQVQNIFLNYFVNSIVMVLVVFITVFFLYFAHVLSIFDALYWDMPISLQFKLCSDCNKTVWLSDPHSRCLKCLRGAYVKSRCPICRSFKSRTKKIQGGKTPSPLYRTGTVPPFGTQVHSMRWFKFDCCLPSSGGNGEKVSFSISITMQMTQVGYL